MKKIAKIIPIRKLPRNLEVFDYLIPQNLVDEIRSGMIVSVLFKNEQLYGLVYEIEILKTQPKYKLKEIIQIIDDKLIAVYQIKLIKWFSNYYHYSLASTARLFVPEIPKRKEQKNRKTEIVLRQSFGRREQKDIQEPKGIIAKLILDINKSKEHFLLINQNIDLVHVLYYNLIKSHLLNEEQILILFPTLAELKYFYAKLNKNIQDQILILDSKSYKTSKNKYHEYYKKIANNESKILLGTRSSIFFNLQNVKTIILDRAEADDYKQWDQSPRYEVSEVLFEQAKHLKAKLIISGFAIRPETFYFAQKNKLKLITIGQAVPERQIKRVEYSSGTENYYLTPSLDAFIKKGLQKKEKILLIVNKKGFSSSFKCQDCGYIAICPTCGLPLTVYPENKLFCQHCLKYETMPGQCPKCKGVSMRSIGIGALGFEHLIKEKYKSENIVVGLPSVYSTKFEKFDRAAFVYFDSLFYLPDFSHPFKVYYLLRKFSQKLFTQNPKIKILIQSNFLENHAVSCFNKPIQEFFKKELEIRKQLKYPPYSVLLKIIFRDKNDLHSKQNAEKIYHKIKNIVKAEVSPPFPVYTKKVRDYYIWQIVIKLFGIEAENKIVEKLPGNVIIDKNPINLL